MTRMTEQQLNAYAEANGMTPIQAALHIMQQPKPLANHPEFPQYKLATNVIIAQLRGRVHELEAKLRKEYEKDRSLKQRADDLVNSVEKMLDQMSKPFRLEDVQASLVGLTDHVAPSIRLVPSKFIGIDMAEAIIEDMKKRETF